MIYEWLLRFLRSDTPDVPTTSEREARAVQAARVRQLELVVEAERQRSKLVLEESGRIRKEATGLWATDLLGDRAGRTSFIPPSDQGPIPH